MRSPLFLCSAIFCVASIAIGDPRGKATDYPAHAESAHVAIGAEYLVHSFSNGRQTYFTPDYLVVDTAVYPHGALVINQGHFRLVVNGATLSPQSPGVVAYTLSNDGFETNPRYARGPKFPGDTGSNPPQVPQAPDPNHPDAQPGPERAEDVVVRTTLQEGEFHSPQSGFLYFAYSGKLKKIKSMNLIYSDDAGELSVPLIP